MAGRGGCSLQSSVLAISVLYLLVLGLLLALATVLALDPGPGLATLLELVDTADSRLAGSAVAASVRGLVTSAQHHLALPLTLLVVLLAATVMLAAGAVFSRPLLLLPWLGLLLLLDLLAASLLVLAMASLEDAWLQTITFLIVAPMLTLAAACWATVLRLWLHLRRGPGKVPGHGRQSPLPPTVYTPQPHSWDAPLPIWAAGLSPVAPPQSAWDPVYLQQHDPRYSRDRDDPRYSSGYSGHPRSSAASRSVRSSGSGHGDTVSLSSKYGEARDTADTGETLYSGDTVSLSSKYRAGAEAGASSEEEASVTRVQHTVQLLQENTQHYHLNTGRAAEPS